jgi:hypothetical protein
VLAVAGFAHPALAQQLGADALIAKNLEARGGAQAIAAIRSLHFEGKVRFPGDIEVDYRETRARQGDGAQSRTDLTLQGLALVQAYDGRTAWRINPFQGRKDAERMSADETRSLADSSLVEGTLLAAGRDGSRVTALPREDFDGTLAYKVKVTQKDGDEFVYWLDPDTFLEIKVDETRRVRGAQQTSETELGDYEKVAGVFFPMSIESWSQGHGDQRQRVIVETAQANVPVNPGIFAQPKGPGQPASAGGEPPDASNKPQGEPETKEPPETPNPPKGE